MAGGSYGPQSANYVTVRPAADTVVSALDTFFKDCTSSTTYDGTVVTSSWLNMVTAQLRTAIRQSGQTVDDSIDNQLWLAMKAAGISITAAAAAPTSPRSGAFWYDTTDGSLNMYVSDGTTPSWIQIN